MSDIVLIGIAGKQKSGKDTIANYLVENYGFVRKGFADFLKELTLLLFDVSKQDLEEKDVRVRKILQDLGQKMREIDEKVWVNQLLAKFDGAKLMIDSKATGKSLRWVISDIRHPNEVEAVRSRGGKVWKVERSKGPEGDLMDHISETALDDYSGFDEVILNTGTIEDLQDSVRSILDDDGSLSHVLEPDEEYPLTLGD